MPRPRHDSGEIGQHLFLAALGDAPGFGLATVKGDHDVVLLPAAQRVMHQVTIGAAPHHRGVLLQIHRKLRFVDHGSVDDVAGYPRVVADVLLAHGRLAAIASDDEVRRFVGIDPY